MVLLKLLLTQMAMTMHLKMLKLLLADSLLRVKRHWLWEIQFPSWEQVLSLLMVVHLLSH